jgi:Endosomal/lysosomal potassium channel TMEM175
MIRVPDLRRLALIGDSVFAVSITLNARAVTIPNLGENGLHSDAFGHFISGVIAVLLSVFVAGAFWLGHWRYFRYVRRASVSLIAAHFAFLLALILLPISTDLYANNQFNPVATLVYGLNLLLLTIVALAFRIVAVRHSPGRVLVRYDWLGLVGVVVPFARGRADLLAGRPCVSASGNLSVAAYCARAKPAGTPLKQGHCQRSQALPIEASHAQRVRLLRGKEESICSTTQEANHHSA